MLKTLKDWWHQEEESGEEPELTLAITKLFVGMMGMNGIKSDNEFNEIIRLLNEYFKLSTEESKELIVQAMDSENNKVRFDKVISLIENSYTVEQRCQIIGHLWRVAIADGEIEFLEEQYINRISSLIDVPTKMLNQEKENIENSFPELKQDQRFQDPKSHRAV